MLTSIVDSTDPRSIAARLRRRRFQLFERLLGQIPKPVRILDIGGTEAFWRTVGFVSVSDVHITLLNVSPQPVSLANFTSIVGDARDLGGFADGSVDVVYSNSVIEHVGGHGDQRRMADEVRRVGVRYFIQTPNRCFPLEPHFVFPFFQFLPIGLRVWLLRHADLGWHKQTSDPEAARRIVEGVRFRRLPAGAHTRAVCAAHPLR